MSVSRATANQQKDAVEYPEAVVWNVSPMLVDGMPKNCQDNVKRNCRNDNEKNATLKIKVAVAGVDSLKLRLRKQR